MTTQDPFLQGYDGAYQGYGGPTPSFNRHFTSITSPPGENKPKVAPLPDIGRGWFKGAGALKDINYHLLISKIFYFFFYAAFGSLFPLIAVYFKQIGMNPSQSGVLIGFRPFVEFISAPFFGNLADKYKIWKQILLFSVFCWIAFTLGLAFVKPPPHACLTANATHVLLVPPWSNEAMNIDPANEPSRRKRSLETLDGYDLDWNLHKHQLYTNKIEFHSKRAVVGNQHSSAEFLHSDDEGLENDELMVYDDHFAMEQNMGNRRSKRSKDIEVESSGELDVEKANKNLAENNLERKIFSIHDLLPHPKIVIFGKSPLPLDHTQIDNVTEKDVEGLVSPPFSSVVFRSIDIQRMFWLILFLMMIGEFFSAPAITLVDTATLGYLEDDVENYGRQRMFGSLGWGIAMFIVGIALDQADVFADHPCGHKQIHERNYMVCFAIFTVFMVCAFLSATRLKFKDGDEFNTQSIKLSHLKGMKDKIVTKVKGVYDTRRGFGKDPMEGNGDVGNTDGKDAPRMKITLDGPGEDMVTDVASTPGHSVTNVVNRPTPFVPRGKPGQAGTLPEWITVMKQFANVKLGSMLFLTWFMGFGVGLVFTFLFWHLQDLGGTPTLFGIASVINHISEVFAYFFSKKLIGKIGHVMVLYLGLAGNIARFLYVSFLRSPWPVLPFELLQGLTHAAVWAACCSYVTQSTPTEYRATAQGLLQGLHHGLGRGCGAVIGGILVYYYGTENVFRGYGITCIIVFAAYFALNFFYIRKLVDTGVTDEHDPKHFFEEGAHLAPCGVPMGMNRNLSSSKLEDMAKQNGEKPQDPSKTVQNGGYAPGPNHNLVMPDAPQMATDTKFQQPEADPRQHDSYGYEEPSHRSVNTRQQVSSGYSRDKDPRHQADYGYGDDPVSSRNPHQDPRGQDAYGYGDDPRGTFGEGFGKINIPTQYQRPMDGSGGYEEVPRRDDPYHDRYDNTASSRRDDRYEEVSRQDHHDDQYSSRYDDPQQHQGYGYGHDPRTQDGYGYDDDPNDLR